jgi:hypothetical protein
VSYILLHDVLAKAEYLILLISKPFGPRNGSTHGARKSQKRIVSPQKMISPLGIKYLPKPVGPCAEDTFAP